MTHAGIEYVKALLTLEKGSLLREIGERMWVLCVGARDELIEYLGSLMATNPQNTRPHEVAYDLWLLMGERGAAA